MAHRHMIPMGGRGGGSGRACLRHMHILLVVNIGERETRIVAAILGSTPPLARATGMANDRLSCSAIPLFIDLSDAECLLQTRKILLRQEQTVRPLASLIALRPATGGSRRLRSCGDYLSAHAGRLSVTAVCESHFGVSSTDIVSRTRISNRGPWLAGALG